MRRFDKQVAVITGAAAGIGLATARRLGSEGCRLALLDSDEPGLQAALRSLMASDLEVVGLCGEAADSRTVEALVGLALEHWDRLDVVVANAAARAFGPLVEPGAPQDTDWERLCAVNLRGTAEVCRAGATAIRVCGTRGAMVLVGSVHALVGRSGMPIYDATKAGILGLARSLAVELAPDGIRVNSVCPGFTITEFHLRRAAAEGRTEGELRATSAGLFGRPADPSEIAAAIAFLASGDASYITATNLMVDAGVHAV